MKLKYLAAVFVVFSLLLFGCIPENNTENTSDTEETTTLSTVESTAATTENSGGVFGSIEDEGEFPEIPFEEFK